MQPAPEDTDPEKNMDAEYRWYCIASAIMLLIIIVICFLPIIYLGMIGE